MLNGAGVICNLHDKVSAIQEFGFEAINADCQVSPLEGMHTSTIEDHVCNSI